MPTNRGDEPPVTLPVNGVLDLHTVEPRDVHWLVPDYIGACRAKGILDVRIIHGKGIMVRLKAMGRGIGVQ